MRFPEEIYLVRQTTEQTLPEMVSDLTKKL